MKYAHLFWKLFGVGYRDWDGLAYADFLWMRDTADQHHQREQEAARSGH